jgi:YggT family protein
MFVLANLFIALARVLQVVLNLYFWLVVVSVVVSWVNPDPYNPLVRMLRNMTEPVYRPLRRVLPLYAGGIDFTPLVVILLIQFLEVFAVNSLLQLGAQLQLR